MHRVCAWCRKHLGDVEIEGEEELITHGICEECYELNFGKKESEEDSENASDSVGPVALMRVTQIEDPDELLKEFDRDNIVIEEKLDGWKAQVIKSGGKIKIYSRKGDEKTDNFPELVEKLSFLPDNTVIEGELVYWDNGKQDESKVTSLAGSSAENAIEKAKELPGKIKLHFYDVLWKDGKNVTDEPFEKRRKLLESFIKKSDLIEITKQYPFSKWQEAMNVAVKKGGEGIVLKIKNKPYEYKSLGSNEPKPAGIMYKYKGSGGKSATDDYVIYDYEMSDKGKLKAFFGQYYKGKLYHISEISNFSEENEEKIKEKLKKGQFTVEIGFQERLPGGLRHQKFIRFRDDKDPKDATMNEFHVENVGNFEIAKKAELIINASQVLDELLRLFREKYKNKTTYKGLRNIPGVDVKKAYDIFADLESNNRFIVGDSGTSFGKTQVQIGNFLNSIANEPNIEKITGISPEHLRVFSAEWEKSKKILSDYNWRKKVSVDENEVRSFVANNKNKIKNRLEATIVPMFPNGEPGVVRIINGKIIGEVLDLNVLRSLGLNVYAPEIMSKIKSIMAQFVTWAVVRNSLARVMAYQKMPEVHDKIMNTFSSQNVSKNRELSEITDKVSQSDLMNKIQTVVNAVKQYGYNTNAPGAYNIYQLIAISNASGPDRVVQFLRDKKPFSPGNLTYLMRANKKIQQETGLSSSMPETGVGGFSYASSDFSISKRAEYSDPGCLYFPSQYADEIKAGKRRMTIRASDVPVEVNEIVRCMTYSGAKICEVRINSKNRMSLGRIEKAYGKRVAKSLEQKFGPKGQFVVIKFEPYKISEADDDEEKWKEVLIDKYDVKLTRQQIKDYYSKPAIRKKIMARIKDNPVLIYIGTERNENVLKRNHKGKPIVINNDDPEKDDKPNNYFYWVDRRMLSIHQVFGSKTDIGFIDLDLHGDFSLQKAKKYAKEVSDKIKEKYNVSSIVYQSGGTGLHIEFKLKEEVSINQLRSELRDMLDELNKNWEDVTTGLVKGTGMRSDISTLHDKGSLRVPGSLGETYGKEKKQLAEADSDDWGVKNIQEPHSEENGGIFVNLPSKSVDLYDNLGNYFASQKQQIEKISRRLGVREEYVWEWDYINHRLYAEMNVKDEIENNMDHYGLSKKYDIKAFTPETNPRGFITFFDDGRIEIDTYEIGFDDILDEARHAVLSRFDLRNKDFKVNFPLASPRNIVIKQKEDKPVVEVLKESEMNKIKHLWKMAEIIDLAYEEDAVKRFYEEHPELLEEDVPESGLARLKPEQDPTEYVENIPPEEDEGGMFGELWKDRDKKRRDKRPLSSREFEVPVGSTKPVKQYKKLEKQTPSVGPEILESKKPEVLEPEIEVPDVSEIEAPVVPEVEKIESGPVAEPVGKIYSILTPVQICEEEKEWIEPCEEVLQRRYFYEPEVSSKEPAELEDIKKKDELELSKELSEEHPEISMDFLMNIGEFDADDLDDEIDIEELKIEKSVPVFGKKVLPPKDENGEIITDWKKMIYKKVEMSDEAWEVFSPENMKDNKSISAIFSDPSSKAWKILQKEPHILQEWILPILINMIGKRWFDINKVKPQMGSLPFGMWGSTPKEAAQFVSELRGIDKTKEIAEKLREEGKDDKEIKQIIQQMKDEGEVEQKSFEDSLKGRKYISNIVDLIAKYTNKYFSVINTTPIDKYLYKYLDLDMRRIVAEENNFSERKVAVCSVCRRERLENSVDVPMKKEEIAKKKEIVWPKMTPMKMGRRTLWQCENCKNKMETLETHDIPFVENKIKEIKSDIASLKKMEQTEKNNEKLKEKKSVLKDLEAQKDKLIRDKRIYEAQISVPKVHTWCPNENCPGQRIPLTAIDWENDFWKSADAKEVLNKLNNQFKINPPPDFMELAHFKTQKAEDESVLEKYEKFHKPPEWLEKVPFVCPHDGVKFKMSDVKGKGFNGRAGYLWDPFQRSVWILQGENKERDSQVEQQIGKNDDVDELYNNAQLSDFARKILIKKYWDERERFMQRIVKSNMDFETAMNNKSVAAQFRIVTLYDTLRQISTSDNIAYVGWLSGRELTKDFAKDGNKIGEQAKFKKSRTEYKEEISLPILQKWVDGMLSYGKKWEDGARKYRIGDWLAKEKHGVKSDWGKTLGTFFVAKAREGNKQPNDGQNIYEFDFNIENKDKALVAKGKAAKNLRLLKVIGIWKIDNIGKLNVEELGGKIDIRKQNVINSLMNKKNNLIGSLISYNFNNIKIENTPEISPNDYVLIQALVMPGTFEHPPLLAISNVRKDNDSQELFKELGLLATEAEDKPEVWKKLNKAVERIEKQFAQEGNESQIEIIKKEIQNLREDLSENIISFHGHKKADFQLSIRVAKDPLSTYKKKRDFDETSEPEGKIEKGNQHRYVIQKHDAEKAKTHFDLRLENDDGVLQSWAIPKHKLPEGKEKLLAMETEPHPIEYLKFKGKIEEGYGKGDVEIWASGKYIPIEVQKGKIIFEIKSGKAKGKFVLFRTDGKRWMFMRKKEE